MTAPDRLIAHVDMDAFFASVSLLRYPQLKGLPVVIGGSRRRDDDPWSAGRAPADIPLADFPRLRDYVGRGVITTATYAARVFGVGSAMGLMQAARRCPEAILLPVDSEAVKACSRRFKAALLAIAPVMEDRGIDEVYLDLTAVPGAGQEGGRVLARRLQAAVHAATGLTCSIGLAPNKLLAKLASDFDKPAGVSVLTATQIPERVWPLPCRQLNGIGPRTAERLAVLGIDTLGDLAVCDPARLLTVFGQAQGRWLHAAARGDDTRPLVTAREPVSLSRETTFSRDLSVARDRAELADILLMLCRKLAEDLARQGLQARTIGIKLRYADFHSLTRDQSSRHAVTEAEAIRELARACLRRAPLQHPLRLLGLRASGLERLGACSSQPAQLRLPSVA